MALRLGLSNSNLTIAQKKFSLTNQACCAAKEDVFPVLPHHLDATGSMNADGRFDFAGAKAAMAEAQEPVPEDCVSPTPRSKKRTRIS